MEPVYEPREDSFLLLRYISKYAKKKAVLDMGTGSGVLAKEAKKYAKSVLAADINSEAIKAARKLGIIAIKSNLFSNIEDSFDLIMFNAPYLPNSEYGNLATDGGEHGFEIIEEFLDEAKNHLNKEGVILLLFSSHTKKEDVDWILTKKEYKFKLVEEERIFFESLYLYEVK